MAMDENTSLLPSEGKPSKDTGSGPAAGFVQLLLANLGPGILTLPYIFTVGGIGATSGMLVFVLALTLYSMRLVLKCKAWLHASPKFINVEYSKRPQSFQDVGREILGKRGESTITVFVVLMQLGICMVFLNFSAENLLAVENFYLGHEDANCLIPDQPETTIAPDPFPPCNLTDAGSTVLPKSVLVMCVAPIPLLLTLGRSSTIVVVSATGATIIMFVALGTVFFLVAWHFYEYFPGIDNVQITPKLPGQLPIVFGNLLYSVTTAVGVLLPIENTLNAAGRAVYPKLVVGALSCHFVLFLMVGLLSNMAFGKQTVTSITAQFIESNIGHPIYISIINCFLSLSVLLTFPLQFRPACEVVERAMGIKDPSNEDKEVGLTMQDEEVKLTPWQKWGFIVVRTMLVVLVAAAAASVPQLDLIVSLAGSFVSCVLAMMVPPTMDLMIMRKMGKFDAKYAFLDVLLIFVGVIGLIGGTGSTFLEIIGIKLIPDPVDPPTNITVTGGLLSSPWTLLSAANRF